MLSRAHFEGHDSGESCLKLYFSAADDGFWTWHCFSHVHVCLPDLSGQKLQKSIPEICSHSPTIIAIFQSQHLINCLAPEGKSHLCEASRYSDDDPYKSS